METGPISNRYERDAHDTQYFENGLLFLYKKDKKLFKEVQESFSKHPLIDLGCGGKGSTIGVMFQDLFEKKLENLNNKENMDPKILFPYYLEEIKELGLLTPKEYIGVDKYNVETKKVDERISFVKDDMVEFLKKENNLGNKANIVIGGVSRGIIEPKKPDNDEYRFELMTEISKVLPEGGYFMEVFSNMKFMYKNKIYKPEDFGLEWVLGDPNTLQVFRKPYSKDTKA
ncbi:MAG: hypothetical protein KBC44_00310 [Candidatus Pacebacteria bacterium]|nr:hypothetical protein [Candidatus Levybacteria bacterium]MBP9839408.1 hypothetical protein [Candidatus Paceibacterota bacterium]